MTDLQIRVDAIGKRFGREWIFRNFSGTFCSKQPTAIVGNNGSGKSTFLKTLIGYLPLSEGKVVFEHDKQLIPKEKWQNYLVWAAPYTELIEEFTLAEQLHFHQQFKPLVYSIEEIMEKLEFANTKHKTIRLFSSGMKQKLKLALAMYANVPLVLLDEPTSNLDTTNSNWYKNEILKIQPYKVLLVASNQEFEYDFCTQTIDIQQLKV